MIVHLNLVMALSNGMEDYSEIVRIIDDCRTYITTFTSIQVQHVYREENGVVHRLAHLTNFSYLDNLHVIIRDVLYENQCTSRSRCTQVNLINNMGVLT